MALPKWATEQMARDERVIAKLTEERDLLRSSQLGPEDSNTRVSHWGDEPDTCLPNGAQVQFTLSSGRRVRVRVDRSGALDVNGDTGLWIRPGASNSVQVTARD